MTEPQDELALARQQLEEAQAENVAVRARLDDVLLHLENTGEQNRVQSERISELEQLASRANNLGMDLNDMTQERDRLRNLLLDCVSRLETFSPDYPQATVARTAFQGETPEEIALKMAEWDAARAQKSTEWSSLVNNVRTQATV